MTIGGNKVVFLDTERLLFLLDAECAEIFSSICCWLASLLSFRVSKSMFNEVDCPLTLTSGSESAWDVEELLIVFR